MYKVRTIGQQVDPLRNYVISRWVIIALYSNIVRGVQGQQMTRKGSLHNKIEKI